jgi:flagellar hook-associated protein 3 FlgL
MRITNNMLISNMITYMNQNLSEVAKYQAMKSTRKLIQKASEDPILASRSLKLNTDVSVLSQYKKNADSALAWMETTETAIKSVSDILIELRTKAVEASNDTLTDDDRQKIAGEFKQMRDELINLANSTYSGRYIFSGYKSDTPLLDGNGFLNAVVSKLEKINYEVGVTNKIQVNVTGDSLFNMDSAVSYLPARSALIQDIDDFIALIDAKATVTSSAPLDLTGPGVYDMSGVSVDISVGGGAAKTVNFDDSTAKYVNRMTTDEIIDYINKKLGVDATASLDKNGNLVVRSLSGAGVAVSDSAGAPGSVAKLLGGPPSATSASAAGVALTGQKSLTLPTVDVTGYAPFEIFVDRGALPITISLPGAAGSLIADGNNARLDEIAAEINRQIASQVTGASPPGSLKWAKCTVEDGRLCLTSESFGPQSYISLSQQDETRSLFGVAPAVKQGNDEQQGKLAGSRDFREPTHDMTAFRSPPPPATGGAAPSVKVTINGTHTVTIQLDDGDPTIDPANMTLRQMMKKIDDCLMGYGTCDIDDGKLVIRASQGGAASKIEMASLDENFYAYLFGEEPTVKNGANDPTHGYYRSGVAYKVADAVGMGGALAMDVTINAASNAPVGPIPITVPDGLGPMEIVDSINSQLAAADPALAQAMLPQGDSQFSFARLVDAGGSQVYPPLNGASAPQGEDGYYLEISSHTWGTGSGVKIESANGAGMAALFGTGTISAPVRMGGVDGIADELCRWLDVADAQLANVNRVWTDLGARAKRAELTQTRLDTDVLVSGTLLSMNEDADLAEATMLFEMAQTVYSASLSVGARVVQTTLMDFLS